MTGDVPYYGGRFSPAQAYAAAHQPVRRRPAVRPAPAAAPPAPVDPPRVKDPEATLAALEQLFETGVVSREEYDDLRARVNP